MGWGGGGGSIFRWTQQNLPCVQKDGYVSLFPEAAEKGGPCSLAPWNPWEGLTNSFSACATLVNFYCREMFSVLLFVYFFQDEHGLKNKITLLKQVLAVQNEVCFVLLSSSYLAASRTVGHSGCELLNQIACRPVGWILLRGVLLFFGRYYLAPEALIRAP